MTAELSIDALEWLAKVGTAIMKVDADQSNDFYISEVKIGCYGDYVGRFVCVDDFFTFQPGAWFGGTDPVDAVNTEAVNKPVSRPVWSEQVANQILNEGSSRAMPKTDDPKSFAQGYNECLKDLFGILDYTPDGFNRP
jgi:hypothetical protein